jgi:hypothetical protein
VGWSDGSAAPRESVDKRVSAREQRRLLSLRRRVAAESAARYHDLWRDLAAAVTAAGSNAWRFVADGNGDLHLEFLEFEASRDPRADPTILLRLARLDDEVGSAAVEEWLEER